MTASGGPANGPSGHPSLSGDNRRTRLAAFDSEATNLVGGDTNGASDVFVWRRPKGSRGITLSPPARPAGTLIRASVGGAGIQANGPSSNPSLDGAVQRGTHCVAFQSRATNLAPGDPSPGWDVYVRDLARGRTVLVSRAVGPDATDPSIDGGCRRVAFTAGGRVLVARVTGGKPRALGAGVNPDYSLDGTAVAWQRGGSVVVSRNGRKLVLAAGENPQVSDAERQHAQRAFVWGVTFDTRSRLSARDRNPGYDVYMRVFGPSGGVKRTDLISAPYRGGPSLGGDSHNGGITAYAPNRGILTFVTTQGGASTLYYRNNNSGNIDDLARAVSDDGSAAIDEVVTSSRANFVAFSSRYEGSFAGGRSRSGGRTAASGLQKVFIKHLIGGEPL